MDLEEFNYHLPPSLIAQYPPSQRGDSRLMILQRSGETIVHGTFKDISSYLHPGDLLVMNDTRVLPARRIGRKETGGKVEILLIPSWNGNRNEWEVLIKGSGKLRPGTQIRFGESLWGQVKYLNDGRGRICFSGQEEMTDVLQKIGHVPLPPYIKREDESLDRDRYQTIFAKRDGSIAAPTAGLHFTQPLLNSLGKQGINIATITLHIGIGTFTPIKVNTIEDHQMEREWAEISEEVSQKIEETKRRGGRVISVGTTTTRALESFSDKMGRVQPGKGFSSLFIYPPYQFRVIDGLITNFHLPKSTLVLLVSAFTGKDLLMKAYQEAIRKNYHFYSYGDAMLIT